MYWFCQTSTWSLHGCRSVPNLNPLPLPSPYHPSGSTQCNSPKHPLLIEARLAILFLYNIIHVSMSFSQIIPRSPFPTESKRLFYSSVSLLLSRIKGYCCHLSKLHMFTVTLKCIPSLQHWIHRQSLYLCHQQSLSSVQFSSVQFSSVTQLCLTLCDPMKCSMPGLPVHHQLPEFTQTHVHRVRDAIQPSHPLSSPSPLAPNPSQHQSLFQWASSSHEVAKVLEFPL